ncbi:hypothetical protein [Methylorubrum salsuginis]|uniref:Uncharacterized protein n=1 Tax=Methylorubrum salsuginis TaxID=414703 RepID=A0A1I4N391_9HYPH|nr:hypothetical protein [Methylorubrum salsuginis]SFM09787.1 hypothetical protein SAMN04488125_1532 [Methylorubrum salsuginis]
MALLKPVHEPYRALLVSIADRLGCRVLAGTVTGMNMLLYDSVRTEGLPFAQGYIGYQTRPAAPPMPQWPRNVVHERDEDYGDTVGFGM